MIATSEVSFIEKFLDGSVSILPDEIENFLWSALFRNSRSDSIRNDPLAMVERLKSEGKKQVCQYQFRKNDIVWICRQCQADEVSSLCVTSTIA